MKKWTGLFLILLALVFILSNINTNKNQKNEFIVTNGPKYEYGILVDSFNVTKGVVQQGQTFGEILYSNHIDHPQISEIVNKSKEVFDFRRVNPGKEYTVICSKDTIDKARYFIYQENPINYVVIDLTKGVDVYR